MKPQCPCCTQSLAKRHCGEVKKEARHCEPGSLHFDLTALFSLDPLSFVLSFSF
jgi:hypothetical protein